MLKGIAPAAPKPGSQPVPPLLVPFLQALHDGGPLEPAIELAARARIRQFHVRHVDSAASAARPSNLRLDNAAHFVGTDL